MLYRQHNLHQATTATVLHTAYIVTYQLLWSSCTVLWLIPSLVVITDIRTVDAADVTL